MSNTKSNPPLRNPTKGLVEDDDTAENPETAEGQAQPTSGARSENVPTGVAVKTAPAYVKIYNVDCEGATAPDGTPWVKVAPTRSNFSPDGPAVWTKLADWSESAAPAKQRLLDGNLLIFGDRLTSCIDEARSIRWFPPQALVDRAGWAPPHFALPSGEAYSPKGSEPAIVIFRGDPQRFAKKGKKVWLTEVGRLASGQSIITFALMVAFMGPLLRLSRVQFNPGFELTGPARVGKSTLQQLATSVVGPAVAQDGQNAWLPANTTVNALEERVGDFNDFLLVIEEMSLFYADAGERTRGAKMRELVFKLASGTTKCRYQSTQLKPSRFVYLTSSNEALSALIGGTGSSTSAAAETRLLTIPIDGARPFGVFDKLPKGFDTSEVAIRAITDLIEDHYGKPIHRFISQLVDERATDEQKLKSRIERHMDKFREAVGVDQNVGPEASIADVFALAYAAGKLAMRYGALPKDLKCLTAAMTVYRMNRELCGTPPSHVERLRRLALRKGVIRIDSSCLENLSAADIAAAPALVRINRQGRKELLLTDEQLVRAFPFKRELFDDPNVLAIMQRDSDNRRTVKRTVRTSKPQERFYVFTLSASENDN